MTALKFGWILCGLSAIVSIAVLSQSPEGIEIPLRLRYRAVERASVTLSVIAGQSGPWSDGVQNVDAQYS